MTTAFRLKTFPELLANAFARYRAVYEAGVEGDLNVGSFTRTILEIMCLSDADQYVQISKLLKLASIDECKGDDLDRFALLLGTLFFSPLRRNPATASIVKVAVGDGTQLAVARFAFDVVKGGTIFSVFTGEGDPFPSSGAIILERGSAREEKVIYTRSADAFSVAAGLRFPHARYGEIVRVATQSILASNILAAATSATLQANTGAAWPTTGTVILDRGTTAEERKTFAKAGDVLTFSTGTAFGHLAGSSAILSTSGSNRSIGGGLQVYVPASESSRQVTFRVLSTGVLRDGDFVSDLLDAQCVVVGKETNVGASLVTKFSSTPFSGATVTNPLPANGGGDLEKDDDYRARLKNFVASLSRGTPLAVETLVLGLRDETTNQAVLFAQVVEAVVRDSASLLYITDGSASFSLDQEVFGGRDVAISDATVGDRRGKLHQSPPFKVQANPLAERTPRIFASVERGASSSVGVDYLEDTSQNMTTDAFANMWLKQADDQFRLIVSNTAIRFNLFASGAVPPVGSYAVLDLASKEFESSTSTSVGADTLTDGSLALSTDQYADYYLYDSAGVLWRIISNTATAFTLDAGGVVPAAGAYKIFFSNRSLPLEPGVGFNFNPCAGELELAFPLAEHDAAVAAADGASGGVGAYTYTTGLGALAQRAVNGDPTDFADFPGIESVGTWNLVTAPIIVSPTITISLLPTAQASIDTITALAQSRVQSYVNGLGIGDTIVLSEIIKLCKEIPGVADVTIVTPLSNVSVGDGQLARVTPVQVEIFA